MKEELASTDFRKLEVPKNFGIAAINVPVGERIAELWFDNSPANLQGLF